MDALTIGLAGVGALRQLGWGRRDPYKRRLGTLDSMAECCSQSPSMSFLFSYSFKLLFYGRCFTTYRSLSSRYCREQPKPEQAGTGLMVAKAEVN